MFFIYFLGLGVSSKLKMDVSCLKNIRRHYRFIFLLTTAGVLCSLLFTKYFADAGGLFSPEVDYLDALPHIQLQDSSVTFICVIRDRTNINNVSVTILYPDGSQEIKPMHWTDTGKYVNHSTYHLLGNYTYYVTLINNNGVRVTTSPKYFWISTDVNDKDSDGIPTWWEKHFNFDSENPYDALLDPDNDGFTNLKEYQMGTNPLKDNLIENAFHRMKMNISYLLTSLILFLMIFFISWYGMRRVSIRT